MKRIISNLEILALLAAILGGATPIVYASEITGTLSSGIGGSSATGTVSGSTGGGSSISGIVVGGSGGGSSIGGTVTGGGGTTGGGGGGSALGGTVTGGGNNSGGVVLGTSTVAGLPN